MLLLLPRISDEVMERCRELPVIFRYLFFFYCYSIDRWRS
ncbi:hypothetical protein SLEP1_g6370 [Rubroshorea leprosula]|uniref:Uncharacterized protein n=1 Tax=Rubroshorea leprosula TaxID=152421 RepID=A0AAV5I378_9ROSI|nr:hypothetical protein SLEP1_g6370 [Rubroshorea leprosula]